MYKLNYCKTKLTMIDISKVAHSHFGTIDITSEEMKTILQNVNKGLTCFVDTKNQTFYFSTYTSSFDKLKEVKAYRDKLLIEQDDYQRETYRDFLLEYHGITVDIQTLKDYNAKVLCIEKAYKECDEWDLFEVKIVKEYSENPLPNVYEIVKPDFITASKDEYIK